MLKKIQIQTWNDICRGEMSLDSSEVGERAEMDLRPRSWTDPVSPPDSWGLGRKGLGWPSQTQVSLPLEQKLQTTGPGPDTTPPCAVWPAQSCGSGFSF